MTGVFTIPPDVSFVEALAAELWREAAGDPLRLTDTLVLLPTRRACRTLREAFLRVTDGSATLLPRMQPLGDVDEAELFFSEPALDPAFPPAIAPLRRQMLLMRLIAQKDKALPLDQAAELAAALADLIDQTQTARGDFANLEKLVEGDLARHWQETVRFLEIVTAGWPGVLDDEGCLDPALRRDLVLGAQAESWRHAPPPHPVIAAGSTASVPAVAELMAVIAAMPQGRVVLPGLDQYLDEEAWREINESHPQYNMKEWLTLAGVARKDVKSWPGVISPRAARVRLLQESMRPAAVTEAWRGLTAKDIPAEAVDGFSLLECEHQQEEADVIALRLRAALEDKNKTAALVTFDRPLAERVAAALRRWGIDIDDSAGTALSSLPLGSFLRDALQAAAPAASAVDCLALLKHPLAACGVEPAQCRRFARQIEIAVWRGVSRAGGWQGTVRALQEAGADKGLLRFAGKLAKLFDPVTIAWPLTLPLEERLRKHLELAQQLAAAKDADGAARLWRGEAGDAATSFFDDWRQAARGMPPLGGEDYLRLFTALMRRIVVRPAYGKHPRLAILGPLEARLHHADLVILGGLNEGAWPPEAPIDPWLSRPMKRDFGLPLPEGRIGLSAHDFVQLGGAKEVLLTRARRVEGAPTVPSRFVLQIGAVLQALGQPDNALEPREPWRAWARMLDTPEKITPCAPPQPCPPVAARPKQLPVTDIGLWQRNPYALYAKRILGLRKLDPIEADVTAAERGSAIHEALEIFLGRHKDKWPPDPLQTLLAAGREAFAPFFDRPEVGAFWWPRFERIAAWFVAREAERRQIGERVLAVEGEGRMKLGTFTLTGRADRIDRLPDGSAAIIDYKTGVLPKKGDIELGYEPQLPLLGLLAEAGGFEDLGKLGVGQLSYWRLRGAGGDEEVRDVPGDLADVIRQAREKLEKLLAAFAKPSTPYPAVPRPRFAPRYDDYAHLARLAEWGVAGGDES